MKAKTLIAVVAAGVTALAPGLAAAEYPDKPITMLIGFRPGGAVDTTGRLLAQAMEKILGQPVVPVTRDGGGGTVMASGLMTAAPDGYTIGMGASAAYTLAPQMNEKLRFKIDDFDHIATVSIPQDAIVVRKDSPWNSLADMIEDAKKNNKTLSFTSQVSAATLMTMAITKKTGVKFNVVNVKGGALGIQQVLGGHVDVTWSGSGWNQQVDAGSMKALASMGSRRNVDHPDLPTLKELGYDFEFTDTFMLSAPKGLPKPVLERLSAAVKKAITPELEKALLSKMKLVADYRDPEATRAFLHRQHDIVAPLVADLKKK
ncbi:MAG: tripartite tricarboxylate transporter substrate binding protein [Burkholderiales bacterium]|nr:tripartite tricarboxylate transporter substrate binding protein [Burkholderiales bacterium]